MKFSVKELYPPTPTGEFPLWDMWDETSIIDRMAKTFELSIISNELVGKYTLVFFSKTETDSNNVTFFYYMLVVKNIEDFERELQECTDYEELENLMSYLFRHMKYFNFTSSNEEVQFKIANLDDLKEHLTDGYSSEISHYVTDKISSVLSTSHVTN